MPTGTARLSDNFLRNRVYGFAMKKRMWSSGILVSALSLSSLTSSFAAAPVTSAKGSHGEVITASSVKIASGAAITVRGTNFDETVGIYLAFCLIPAAGSLPTPCGGGVNMSGTGDASYWISSNPPPYGVGVAQPFLAGGRFTKRMHLSYLIKTPDGKILADCKKVACAITIRADHLRESDRNYDIFLPITFISPKK